MPLGRKKRMIWWPYPTYYGGSDASQIFSVSTMYIYIIPMSSIRIVLIEQNTAE